MSGSNRWCSGFVEERTESVEPAAPECTSCTDPLIDDVEGVGHQLAGAHATDLFGANQAAAFEHLHVLHDGGEGQLERRGEIADGGGSAREPFDHGASVGFGEGMEDGVEVGRLKHKLEYIRVDLLVKYKLYYQAPIA